MQEKLNQLRANFTKSTSSSRFHIDKPLNSTFSFKPVKIHSGVTLAALAATQFVNPAVWAFWDKVEIYEDKNPNLVQEQFLQGSKYTLFPAVSMSFGSDSPSSSLFMLHFARNWKKNLKSEKNPVLLIPGAGDHAHRAFADPSYGIPGLNRDTGLAQYLDDAGYPLFAITFAHSQGDNFIQCHQLSNAIDVIKKATGFDKIDIVAHSKGNIPARMYVSNISSVYKLESEFFGVKKFEFNNGEEEKKVNVSFPSKKWLAPFGYDVRRYVQLAAPNKGVDATFRAFSASATAYISKQAPIPFIRYIGQKSITFESIKESIYYEENNPRENNYFPGQCQMLKDLSEDIPLSLTPALSYSFTSNAQQKMYYGGRSAIGDSMGIEYAIAQGGYLIDRLRQKGTSNRVEVATIAGTKKLVNVTYAGLPVPISYEGVDSDGLLFYKSASDTEGINNSMGVYDFNVNHLEITYSDEVSKFIDEILSY
jgi:triacylglycerol esterase/lipase EstA (alpha/beta hydrolase family)